MKKIIAIICTIAMLLSFGVNAFASDWDFVEKKYLNYEGDMEFFVELNKPLEVLSLLNEEAPFDVKGLAESLLKTKINAKIQAEVTDDLRCAKMYLKINPNMPIHISEDIKLDASMTGHMWIEYNFNNLEDAKYVIVFKNPLNGEYLYLDFFDAMMKEEGFDKKAIFEEIDSAFRNIDKASVDRINEIGKNGYKKYAKLSKNDEYTEVVFTNNALIDYVFEVATELMEEGLMDADVSNAENIPDEATMKALVKGLGIFGENDACVSKYKLDKDGYITESEEKIHLEFNVFETAMALGAEESDVVPFTKENSDIDITLCVKAVYSKINEKNVVIMPSLTNENSKSFLEFVNEDMADSYYEEDFTYEEKQSEKFWDYAKGKMERNGTYVDMEEFLESSMWDDDNLSGEVELVDNAVVMSLRSNTTGELSVIGSVKEDTFLVNGYEFYVKKPFIEVSEYNWETYKGEKKVYVNIEVLKYMFGCEIQSMTIYLMDENGVALTNPEYHFELVRPNFGYVPEEKEAPQKAESIGIIGGADGPVKIFVTE